MIARRIASGSLILGTFLVAAVWGDDEWLDPRWTIVEGGVVRGDPARREMALIFTADRYGEGTPVILDTLRKHHVAASFFLTGAYLKQSEHEPWLQRMVAEGHYVGPHSHGHALLSPWDDRQQSLVTEDTFKADLRRNLSALRNKGVPLHEPTYFIPPFEWYNSQHAQWARELGCLLFNFTPGSGSHRDWIPESHPQFKPSAALLADILAYEQQQPDGLNGHLLLMHLGSQRQDKMPCQLDPLIQTLRQRGYAFLRVDRLLAVE